MALSTPSASTSVGDKLVCFALAGQTFGVPIRAVKETLPMRPVTRVFLVPKVVAGLVNLRGEVVALLDLAELVGLPHPQRQRDEGAIVILRPAETGRQSTRAACGLVVDRLLGVRELAPGALVPPPATVEPEAASYLRGIAPAADGATGAALCVLDPERVLQCERLKPFRRRAR